MPAILEMFKNKYGKYSISKIIPVVWFVYLLYALAVTFHGKDIPKSYYDLTMVFSSVYVGKTAVDKIKDGSPVSVNPTPITPTPPVVATTPVVLSPAPAPAPTTT
jgi:hypothetical protein